MKVQVYTAESRVRQFPDLLRDMFRGMIHSRYLAYRLTVKDIKADYSKSAFGMFWDLFDPLVLGLIFYILMRARLIDTEGLKIPYSVFMISGLMLYQGFADAAVYSTEMMTRSRGLLKQVRLAPEALILSVFFRIMFYSLFRIVVIAGFAIAGGAFSPIGFLKFLAAYPIIVLAGMAIGVLFAPFNAIYADVGRFVRVGLTPLRYISPIMFVFPPDSGLAHFNRYNPLSLILENLRTLLTLNAVESIVPTAIACGILAVIGLIGWFLFHLSVPVLAARG